ncbi:glycerophosphocholine phosphodiesterase GPCPD1 [Anabrus simplex]|uniref:glycerophosphocholine phosphodiesterase GPCPD1 n=1 Tax=Anabrus simplex TaxID=316456 RepID=UPI0035A2A1A2
MKELKKDWRFRVQADTLPGEVLCVVGSCAELGNWYSNGSVQLSKESASEDSNIWSGVVSIVFDKDVQFRYFVAVVIEPESNFSSERIIVRRWETHINPRCIKKDAVPNINGTADEFDTFGYHNQITCVERGWLTSETVIQLKLFNNPLQLWKRRYEGKRVYLKVTPVNLTQRSTSDSVLPFSESVEESVDTHDQNPSNNSWPLAEIAVLNEENRELHLQEQFGHVYNEEEFILFHINVHHPESVAYLVDFYICNPIDPPEEPPNHIGFSYILPSILKSSEGQAIVPITSNKHRPIGQLTVEYLVVQPIKDYNCNMSVSYARMWKQSWQGLDVGHRGLGDSFKQVQSCSDVRENTIASLKTAAMHGADLVEFDVQLTKDLVPVLYHDFYVCIAMKRKKQLEEHDMLELPVKDLTLEQLQLLKVYHVQEGKNKNPRFFDEELEEHQPFPTLKQALDGLDPHVGFNVEIKWTMQLKDGSFELYHPFDLNLYLDIVLKVVLQHAGNRKIIFSCFHPDICTMIRLKQNKYPVMFLTQGITSKYPAYHDPRTQTIPMGVHFAVCSGILGINVHTEDLLRDPSQVKLVRDAGLVIFCWGEDNNNSSTIKHLKKLGLHAIIYDSIDQFGMKEVKESIFLMEEREAQKDLLKVAQEVEHPQPQRPSSSDLVLDVGTARQTLSELTVSQPTTNGSIWNCIYGDRKTENGAEANVS